MGPMIGYFPNDHRRRSGSRLLKVLALLVIAIAFFIATWMLTTMTPTNEPRLPSSSYSNPFTESAH
jgi:hypothetical protein